MKTNDGFLHTNTGKHHLSQQEMDGKGALGALRLPDLLTDGAEMLGHRLGINYTLPQEAWSRRRRGARRPNTAEAEQARFDRPVLSRLLIKHVNGCRNRKLDPHDADQADISSHERGS